MEQPSKDQKLKKTVSRLRSPNYPNYTLRECVGFLKKIYSKYGKRDVSIEEAVIQMGHSPTSSTAPRVLASMRAYGLITSGAGKESKLLHVTPLGQTIALEQEESDNWFSALREAALSDGQTKTLYGLWGAGLPSEGGIKIKLEKNMDYSSDGAKRFAYVITDNFAFAQVTDESPNDSEEDTDRKADRRDEKKEGEDKEENKTSSQPRKANLLLPGVGREIVILAPNDLTDTEFELIFKWLELQKFGLVLAPVKKDSSDDQE